MWGYGRAKNTVDDSVDYDPLGLFEDGREVIGRRSAEWDKEHDGNAAFRDKVAKEEERRRKEREARNNPGPVYGPTNPDGPGPDYGPVDPGPDYGPVDPGPDYGPYDQPDHGRNAYDEFMHPDKNGDFNQWWAKLARGGIGALETLFPFLRIGGKAADWISDMYGDASGGGSGGGRNPFIDGDSGGGHGDYPRDPRLDVGGDFWGDNDGYVPPEYHDRGDQYDHDHGGIPREPRDPYDPGNNDTPPDGGGGGSSSGGGGEVGGGGGGVGGGGSSDYPYYPKGNWDYGYSAGPVRMAGGSNANLGGVDINALLSMLNGGR